jgi:hypothetical protein
MDNVRKLNNCIKILPHDTNTDGWGEKKKDVLTLICKSAAVGHITTKH